MDKFQVLDDLTNASSFTMVNEIRAKRNGDSKRTWDKKLAKNKYEYFHLPFFFAGFISKR